MSQVAPRAELRLFQLVVIVAALVPITAGAAGVWRGPAMISNAVTHSADLESHYRYLSGLLLGIGIAFVVGVADVGRRAGLLRALGFIVVMGGLARLLGAALGGISGRAAPFPLLHGAGRGPRVAAVADKDRTGGKHERQAPSGIMSRIANRKLAAALAVIATFGCTPLTAFDALVPKDSGVMLAVDGAPYGSDPRQRVDVYRPRSGGDETAAGDRLLLRRLVELRHEKGLFVRRTGARLARIRRRHSRLSSRPERPLSGFRRRQRRGRALGDRPCRTVRRRSRPAGDRRPFRGCLQWRDARLRSALARAASGGGCAASSALPVRTISCRSPTPRHAPPSSAPPTSGQPSRSTWSPPARRRHSLPPELKTRSCAHATVTRSRRACGPSGPLSFGGATRTSVTSAC